jgi:beta-glucosidase
MKLKTILLSILLVFITNVFAQENTNSLERAKALLSKMTLEEKVGQMTQLTIEMISKGVGNDISKPHAIDTAKLRNVIVNLGVGSILNVSG